MARIKSSDTTSRRDIIKTEAALLIRQKGYKAASMRDLATRVGVEAASLYNHISSKSDLLQTICFSVAHRFMLKMEEVENKEVNILQKIEILLRYHINEMVNHYEEVYVSDREWRHLSEPYLSDYQELRRSYRKRFTALIENGIAQKEIKEIDAPTAVLIVLHAIGGIESWHRSKDKINTQELENNMITILIDGLKN
jgi:AcrR family transcriptional regulator